MHGTLEVLVQIVPVSAWELYRDRVPPELWTRMHADPPEASFGMLLMDGHLSVHATQGGGAALVWDEAHGHPRPTPAPEYEI